MLKVLLCGGGNAIHILSAYVSVKSDTHVTILSLFSGEADILRNAIPGEGIQCVNHLGDDVMGKPDAVISKARDVPTDLDIVIFALPNSTHELYLKAMKPYLKQGVSIGTIPGDGGFAFCASNILGSDFVQHCNIFALETLPWACRIIKYGKTVKVLSSEEEIGVFVSLKHGTTKDDFLTDVLHNLIVRFPASGPENDDSTGMLTNSGVCHQAISKNIVKLFHKPALINYGFDEYECVIGDDIGDKENVYTVIRTKKICLGFTHPIPVVERDDEKKRLPKITLRYFIDAPHRSRRRGNVRRISSLDLHVSLPLGP